MTLTEADRNVIAEARRIGPALRAMDSEADRLAGWLLKELADLAERLAGRLGARPVPACPQCHQGAPHIAQTDDEGRHWHCGRCGHEWATP